MKLIIWLDGSAGISIEEEVEEFQARSHITGLMRDGIVYDGTYYPPHRINCIDMVKEEEE